MVLSTSSTALAQDYIPGLSSATLGHDPYRQSASVLCCRRSITSARQHLSDYATVDLQKELGAISTDAQFHSVILEPRQGRRLSSNSRFL